MLSYIVNYLLFALVLLCASGFLPEVVGAWGRHWGGGYRNFGWNRGFGGYGRYGGYGYGGYGGYGYGGYGGYGRYGGFGRYYPWG